MKCIQNYVDKKENDFLVVKNKSSQRKTQRDFTPVNYLLI